MSMNKTSLESPILHELSTLLDDGFLIVDRDQVISMANSTAVRYLGENLLGQTAEDVFISPHFANEFESCLAEDRTIEFVSKAKADRLRQFRVRLRPINQDNIAVLVMDMTLQHNLEKVRRDFVANVSHELRSPLTSLIGFIETMQMTPNLDDTAKEKFLGIMDEESRRMSRLIDDLLSLSKVETEEHIKPTAIIHILKLVHSVIASMGNRAAKMDMAIEFNDLRDDANSDLVILGEHDEMMEVFHNLLDNALKYGHDGTSVQVTLSSPKPNLIKFDITNHGDGIEQKHLGRLTERFYRVDKGRSREMGGTGLGLAIVKHIVSRHRGTIKVESEMGQSTTFSVILPRQVAKG